MSAALAEPGASRMALALTVNGRAVRVAAEPRSHLGDVLRDGLDLTGTHLGCEHGICGACTVLLDGEPAYSCLTLALSAVGREVTTIEGLGDGDELSAVQEELCAHDGLMCGFCTPGFAMSLTATIARKPDPTLDDIRAGCAGNLCRCGTYPHLFQAGLDAARHERRGR